MKWSIVVSASKGYIPGIRALLNSFEHYHGYIKIYLLDYDLPSDFTDGLKSNERLDLEVVKVDGSAFPEPYNKNSAWATKIPRFKFASEELDGVCMMVDADMYFCSNWDMYFEIAEAGFIVGGANGSNFYFGPNYAEKWGEPIDHFCYKTIGSVPTILDLDRYRHIWAGVYESKHNMKPFCDFELLNILIIKNDCTDRILVLPSQQVTGLHHFQMRPDTRVRRIRDRLITADGLEVLMVHGKWWQEGYADNMMKKLTQYCGEDQRCLKGARESWEILKQEFSRWNKE